MTIQTSVSPCIRVFQHRRRKGLSLNSEYTRYHFLRLPSMLAFQRTYHNLGCLRVQSFRSLGQRGRAHHHPYPLRRAGRWYPRNRPLVEVVLVVFWFSLGFWIFRYNLRFWFWCRLSFWPFFRYHLGLWCLDFIGFRSLFDDFFWGGSSSIARA